MDNSHCVIKFYGNNIVKEKGEGHVHLEDVYLGKGLERLEIINVISNGFLSRERSRIYYFGHECSKEDIEGKKVILTGNLVYRRQKISRYVITESGAVYAVGRYAKVFDPSLIVDGKLVEAEETTILD